jgi:hypothetical protein
MIKSFRVQMYLFVVSLRPADATIAMYGPDLNFWVHIPSCRKLAETLPNASTLLMMAG